VPHKYTPAQTEFIREVAPGRYNNEIANLFNIKFGTNVTEGQIKSFKANHKIQSNVPRKRIKDDDGLFTREQKSFINENVEGLSNQKLASLVNEIFNLSITAKQMKTWKNNHGLSSGLKGSEGISPPNKGTKGLYNVGGNRTSFKPGQQPNNYKPIGTERVDRDGYTLIKVSDQGAWHKRWRHKHKVLWEEVNGPIPQGHCLIFLDGNNQNTKLANLQLITRKQLVRLNQNHLISDNPDVTRTGIIIADIYSKIGERKKGK
jgi:HNH endonuclease